MYNVERYVEAAIISVLNQTYVEWELIIVDDGSTDNSLRICKKYEKMDSRIRTIFQENGGVSSARNKGLEYVQGEWIYFMDADDWIAENCFETIIGYLQQKDVDIINWNYMREDSGKVAKASAIIPYMFIEEHPKNLVKEIIFPGYAKKEPSRKKGALRTLCTKLFRASIIDNIRFDEKIKIGEDALFCVLCCHRARKVLFVNEYLYYYRKVRNSADQKYREDIETVFNQLLESVYQFLQSEFGKIEINTCFAGLAYDCVARALEKKFVHTKNPATLLKRISQIESFVQNKWITQAFEKEIDWSVFQVKHKAVIYCMKWKIYGGLYVLQKMKELKKMKERKRVKNG